MEKEKRGAKSSSVLNPRAEPWDPEKEKGTEEERTIFVTFSRGYALSPLEILSFFTCKYGYCVEDIYIHHKDWLTPPLFGKVVFLHRSIVWMILKDQDQAQFTVGDKTLWCKRFNKYKKPTHLGN